MLGGTDQINLFVYAGCVKFHRNDLGFKHGCGQSYCGRNKSFFVKIADDSSQALP
jgi:hypothetical protein